MRPGRRPSTLARRLPPAQLLLLRQAPPPDASAAPYLPVAASSSTGLAYGTRLASSWSSAAPLLVVTGETASSIGVAPPWMLLAATVVGLPVALWSYKVRSLATPVQDHLSDLAELFPSVR